MADISEGLTRERFGQLVRAGLPFNAVSGQEMTGANLERLQRAMRSFEWVDPRFVTADQAQRNGWAIKEHAPNIQVLVRNSVNGAVDEVSLFNASVIDGIPSIEAMQKMTDMEITAMNANGPELDDDIEIAPARALMRSVTGNVRALTAEQIQADKDHYRVIETSFNNLISVPNDALSVDDVRDVVTADIAALHNIVDRDERHFAAATMGSMAEDQKAYKEELARQAPEVAEEVQAALAEDRRRVIEKENRKAADMRALGVETPQQVLSAPGEKSAELQSHVFGDAENAGIEGEVTENGYAILAPYWLHGLHNAAGVALAEELNKAIKDAGIGKDKEAIEKMIAVHPDAVALGLQITTYERYRDDPHLRTNAAQPRTLLDGALVRDKAGAYRPAAGGMPVLMDNGESLQLKSKKADGYSAAMELAIAKGWTAIELKGKPAMLADAWLEAKLKGLDVVNYVPNEQDKARYAERVAQESARKMQLEQRSAEQTPEMVEVRPFVDANGETQEARITYTVAREEIQAQDIISTKDTAKGAARVTTAAQPSLVRTTVRIGDHVRTDTLAAGNIKPGMAQLKSVEKKLDQELSEAVNEINSNAHAVASLARTAAVVGEHIGPVVAVDGNMIAQKTGRDPDKVTWHDISKLDGRVPKVGEMAEIKYSNGIGRVKEEKKLEREMGGSRGHER